MNMDFWVMSVLGYIIPTCVTKGVVKIFSDNGRNYMFGAHGFMEGFGKLKVGSSPSMSNKCTSARLYMRQ